MRLSNLVVALSSAFSCLSAASVTTDRFQRFKSESPSSSALRINDTGFDELTKAPRDYHVALLLTALPAHFGCQPCREFQPEWDLLASQWHQGDKAGASRVLFATADFPENKGAFAKVSLITRIQEDIHADLT